MMFHRNIYILGLIYHLTVFYKDGQATSRIDDQPKTVTQPRGRIIDSDKNKDYTIEEMRKIASSYGSDYSKEGEKNYEKIYWYRRIVRTENSTESDAIRFLGSLYPIVRKDYPHNWCSDDFKKDVIKACDKVRKDLKSPHYTCLIFCDGVETYRDWAEGKIEPHRIFRFTEKDDPDNKWLNSSNFQ